MRVRTYNDLVRDVAAMTNVMNRLFDRSLAYDYAGNGGSTEQPRPQGNVTLPIDVWATAEAFHIAAYVPGVDPSAVEITFEGDELTIRGQLPQAPAEADFVRRELYHGGFERRVSFNVPVNPDGIEAHFSNGLLTLRVPKAEAVRPKQIKVQVK
ncbi:Hsp20/alpha crystallin family protein [uncultured Chloroflexus sp.]|uniref:Hsp20/alpha crystallin family protein n=1 Tax=uncultured Chloroflexus sp. TaxID=214040 RepID=UPI0026394598|nr:Hsp20/alpha crystallin family protein [uncultured Chloroflexus sp.]